MDLFMPLDYAVREPRGARQAPSGLLFGRTKRQRTHAQPCCASATRSKGWTSVLPLYRT